MCRHSCPVSNADGRETHTPQSKMDTLNELRSGKLAWTPENTAPLYACTGCRACTGYCEHDNEPALVLMAGRSQANAEGAGHPALEKYPERFRSRDARLATKLKEHVPSEQRGDSGLVGFWPGCDAVDKGMQDLEAALEIFGALGGEPVIVVDSEQVCGGYPLLAAGYPDMFRWHAERVANSMAKFKTIITNCSACLFTVQRQYAAEGIDLDVDIISVPEYLTAKLQELPKRTNKKPVYYHDPCHLARYSGVIEEPRLVLSRIAELRDFDWSHSDAESCPKPIQIPPIAWLAVACVKSPIEAAEPSSPPAQPAHTCCAAMRPLASSFAILPRSSPRPWTSSPKPKPIDREQRPRRRRAGRIRADSSCDSPASS